MRGRVRHVLANEGQFQRIDLQYRLLRKDRAKQMQPRAPREPVEARHPGQRRRRHQHLAAAEQKLGPPAAQEHELLAGQNALARRTPRPERTAPDAHRLRDACLLGEAMEHLCTVVAGHNAVARAQPFDGHRAAQRHHADAGRQPAAAGLLAPRIMHPGATSMGVA